jgi:hypothetical protein
VDDLEAVVDEQSANGVSFERYDEPRITTDAKGIAVVGDGKGAWFRIPTAISRPHPGTAAAAVIRGCAPLTGKSHRASVVATQFGKRGGVS